MTNAFYESIISPLGEDLVLSLINVLAASQDPGRKVDFKAVPPNKRQPIVECLSTHPGSVKLVRRLAELGCDVNAQFETQLDNFAEPANALAWAVCPSQSQHLLSSVAVQELIDVKGENGFCSYSLIHAYSNRLLVNEKIAQVNFTALISKSTPLILASRYHRGDIVKKLIKANADPYIRGYLERAPLFFASREGDLDAVKALLKVKYRPNDGSLHEAARNLYSDIVAVLIKGGHHDANFPSSRSELKGRTPLQEMALRCDGSKRSNEIEATIVALEKGKASIFEKWNGRNSLFLALENSRPETVTRALLDTVMLRAINDDNNVKVEVDPQTRVKYFLSPTMYLQMGRSGGPTDNQGYTLDQTGRGLLQLLRTKNCLDRYYVEFGADQLSNAVGMPEDIAKEDKKRRDEAEKRKTREADHQEKLRREYDEAQLKDRVDASKHQAWRQREFEKTVTKVDTSSVVHQTQLAQHGQRSTQQSEALEEEYSVAALSKVRNVMIENDALRQKQEQVMDEQKAH
ncbi:hypothetical protein BJ875DRAFT_489672 [Amylocarpus encephaloides]|uniref:Ankyrin repeat protein n=1 Tax=Amylocarpus encephaloides TaxID=45428 RepID=A0A9P7Y7T8_9HELO|nr:hypothetical protein BJ875DRAFT_489672 [Amylocarpus encephaloides]